MKLAIPLVDLVIVCECGKCCSLIVENQNLLYQILCDLTSQLRGEEGKIILSHNNRVLQISKSLELFSQFVPFELNDYYGAAEPPVRCGVSHLSGLTEPLH